jgi:hypothetical protein
MLLMKEAVLVDLLFTIAASINLARVCLKVAWFACSSYAANKLLMGL